MLRRIRKVTVDRDGISFVEMALVLPVLLFVLMAVVEWGWLLYVRQSMYHAAREAIRDMAIREMTPAQAQTEAEDYLQTAVGTRTFTFTMDDGSSSGEVSCLIEITAWDASIVQIASIGQWFLTPQSATMRAYDSMLIEWSL